MDEQDHQLVGSSASVASFPLADSSANASSDKTMPNAGPNILNGPNINFRPTTTAQSRCSKLKVHVLLDSTYYVAGGNLYGRMELTSSTSRSLKMCEISVELTAYEGE